MVAGQTLLTQCGNSGNTTEPHLHVQVQDTIEFSEVTKTLPINFVDSRGQFKFARANDIVKSAQKIE
ncbi:hypothetical protein [Aliikangiella sp. IMCC44359]|uniref:hypothetical protein n=1 Tax=Aliikangiella sp. IMCC44359 TaxID=3459125 RepID=UPI00403AAB5D